MQLSDTLLEYFEYPKWATSGCGYTLWFSSVIHRLDVLMSCHASDVDGRVFLKSSRDFMSTSAVLFVTLAFSCVCICPDI